MNVRLVLRVLNCVAVVVSFMTIASCKEISENESIPVDIHAVCSNFTNEVIKNENGKYATQMAKIGKYNILFQGPYRAKQNFWPRYLKIYSGENTKEKSEVWMRIYSNQNNDLDNRGMKEINFVESFWLEMETFTFQLGSKEGWKEKYLEDVTYFDELEGDVDYYIAITTMENEIEIGLDNSGGDKECAWIYDGYKWINLAKEKKMPGALMIRLIIEQEEVEVGDYDCLADFL